MDGYIGLTETELRQTLAEAGIREGERKPDSYDDAKAALYKNHREITWVSIFEDGRADKGEYLPRHQRQRLRFPRIKRLSI